MAVIDADRERIPLGLGLARTVAALGGIALGGSLFLVWSHQLPLAERRAFPATLFTGIPANPNAFQVYAIADVVLAVLAVGILAAGLWGRRPARGCAAGAAALGLIFVVHAASTPPTNGVLLSTGTGAATHYVRDPATAGIGETLALIGLVAALLGLVGSLFPWRPGTS